MRLIEDGDESEACLSFIPVNIWIGWGCIYCREGLASVSGHIPYQKNGGEAAYLMIMTLDSCFILGSS